MIRLLPASRHSLVASRARRRRGTAYIFVLSLCILIAVVAVTLLSGSQIRARIIVANNDVTEASVLAESAVERVLTLLVSDPNWRTTYSNGIETTPITLGRGTISLKLVDEADGSLANDPTQPVRAYGIGRVGSTTRIYSVQLRPYDAPLDVLKTACHAGGNASTSSVISAAGGPFSANGTLTINSAATVNGNVEAPVVSNLRGTVNGAVKVVPVKQLPSATVFDSYKAQATEILFSGISGGTITPNVLSPPVNPPGATNPQGISYIPAPSTGSLSINQTAL